MDVYLIYSNNGSRTKVSTITSTLEKAKEYLSFLDSLKPASCVRESEGLSTKYFRSHEDGKLELLEHVFVEKRGVL